MVDSFEKSKLGQLIINLMEKVNRIDERLKLEETIEPSVTGIAVNTEKTWAFSSPAGTSGTFYIGGFYFMNSGNNDFSPSINFGTSNSPYAAHFFIVLGEATVDELTIRVTGTSINDTATRTAGDTQDIVIPNGTPADSYYETSKKWIGQVSVEVIAGTPKQCNYGHSKYWDNSNKNFTVVGLEATFLGGANDTGADIQLIHHKTTGWTYNAGSTPTPPTAIATMAGDHVTENDVKNGEPGAWKRTDLNTPVEGNDSEGTIIAVVTTANKTFEQGNFLLTIQTDLA